MRKFDKYAFTSEALIRLRDAVPHPRRVASRAKHDNKNQDPEVSQSRLAQSIVRISTLFRRSLLPLEVLFQNNGGSHGIHGGSCRRFLLPSAPMRFVSV